LTFFLYDTYRGVANIFFRMALMRLGCFIAVFIISLVTPFHAESTGTAITGKDGSEMVFVPEGAFIMGLPEDEPGSDQNPSRKLYLEAFFIDKYEVTNALYRRCVADGGCAEPSLITDYAETLHEDGKNWYRDGKTENYPVVGITWRQAGVYCEWTGKRLPLSSEWEKAARGTDGRRYPWGNEWDGKKANWDDGGRIDGFSKIAPVGSFQQGASPYGAQDMAGNVREWVDNAILKGGSWYSNPESLRAGDPGHEYTVERDDDMGFRCAKDVKGTGEK
jgi:formylglycine-generating enzyme required for sulfatase activity